ncbi:hypothetical protein RFI_27454, partial [Reticulomyxa filosa]
MKLKKKRYRYHYYYYYYYYLIYVFTYFYLFEQTYINRELRVLKRISSNNLGEKENPKIRCPFVIELLGHGWYKRHCYFVFPYFEVTLQQHLEYISQMNLESVDKIKKQMDHQAQKTEGVCKDTFSDKPSKFLFKHVRIMSTSKPWTSSFTFLKTLPCILLTCGFCFFNYCTPSPVF